LISDGRLLMGLGQGWRPEEIEAFGLTPKQLATDLESAVTFFRSAWAGEKVKSPRAETEITLHPQPATKGGPPIWIGAEAEVAIRRAGRIGDGWQATMVTPESFGRTANWAISEHNHRSSDLAPLEVGLHHATYVSNADDPWAEIRKYHQHFIWKSEHMTDEYGGQDSVSTAGDGELAEDFAKELIAVGSPSEVVEEILRFQEQVDRPIHYAARLCYPGLPLEQQLATMRLFADEVMPELRKAQG